MKADILPLTSLRFFAALAVFASHLPLASGAAQPFLNWLGKNVFYEGYWGVAFFFVLSGFILTVAYQKRLNNTDDRYLFWLARFARIYPLHLLTFLMALVTPSPLFNTQSEWLGFITVSNLLLLQSFVPSQDFYFSYNAPSWSLSNEAFFYALFPALIFLSRRIRLGVLALVLAVCWLVVSGVALALDSQPSLLHWLIYIFPPTRLLEFCCGIAVGLLFLKSGERFKNYCVQRGVGTRLELLAFALFALAFSLHSFIPQGLKFSPYYTPIFTLIVFVFALESGILSRLLSAPRLVYLGEISFAFYMIHQLVIRFLAAVVNKLELVVIDDKTWLFALSALVISLIGSALLFRFYEIPARQLIRTTGTTLLSRAKIQVGR